ncbi:transcription-repair coupling factor [Candidatus Neoehrlichia procyonis]|uniref:Transcription-repair-coupling factor n=1 Tax=Candidatus Neoehrlichia procyonis str. RAC413 TaxID=1359163 RepID=A0A0F3NMB1_9RICK|nr:transcription-repair coupling factor [Candidatus Neoehrlichia lotoris]KJV69193.1 transcription-repair coupling factor [Candidatus Neoehrlichia lotoris str. RAC413]
MKSTSNAAHVSQVCHTSIVTNVSKELEHAFIVELYKQDIFKSAVYIMDDEALLHNLSTILQFYIPHLNIVKFPSWDFIPYKKTSPSNFVMAQRIQSLYSIIVDKNPYIVITTLKAISQKVLPRAIILNSILRISTNETITMSSIVQYLIEHGYNQSNITREIGYFSVRSNIIDIFPLTSNLPIRIDFNDEVIESIRTFDPNTQITTQEFLKIILIYPASEIIKTSCNIDNFNDTYAQRFCDNKTTLCNAINIEQKYIGEEHWLPLFYQDKLETLFDYTMDATLIFNDALFSNIEKYTNNIQENYMNADSQLKQLNPRELYLDLQEYKYLTQRHKKVIFCQLDIVNINIKNTYLNFRNLPIKITFSPNFQLLSKEKRINVFQSVTKYLHDMENHLFIITCYSAGSLEYITNRFKELNINLLRVEKYHDIVHPYNVTILPIKNSFITQSMIVITEHDLINKQLLFTSKCKSSNIVSEEIEFNIGDIVVHKEYGVGQFADLETIKVIDNYHDFLKITYYNNDKLFIPVENINLIAKYGTNHNVTLDRLGSTAWQERKAKLKNRIKDIAKDLLQIEAMRLLTPGKSFYTNQQYLDFCADFPHIETEDQIQAIRDVENDLAKGIPMNRLVCGDVGFGKTEIALRAAFLVANENSTNQVAIIVPTTLLCRQHFMSFQERFKRFKYIKVRQFSRVLGGHARQKVQEELLQGNINIIIGTHALLSKNVKFFNLNLLIIDEEHHFGVQQKEALKKFKVGIHVLSLSATPIPRTLHMSLSGVKNLSIIRTPPVNRIPVDIFIIYDNYDLIKEAIVNEYKRGGRVFYVCPFISDIDDIYEKLTQLVPNIKINIAHGNISPGNLDKIMNNFFDGKFTILLTTSIIECGIDIPYANTIIIHNANMFGLAQLYQLKGRVGRSNIKGYAYFVILNRELKNTSSIKRLEIIKSLNSIGSGFSLSLQDMDIRGFGNLIGEEQSGNIKEVGIELYQKMLKEEISVYQNNMIALPDDNITINVNVNVVIPESYVSDLNLRIRIYKNIGSLKTKEEIDMYSIELFNRFGKLPLGVVNLLNIIYIKQLCASIGVCKIEQMKNFIILYIYKSNIFSEKLLSYLMSNPSIFKIQSNGILITIADKVFNPVEHLIPYLIRMNTFE